MSDDPKKKPEDGKKKKKERAPPPPCPAGVSTAYLLLRGATEAVVGANFLETSTDFLQPTYIKEAPVLSGKFSISMGKKLGFGELALPEGDDEEGKQAVLKAIETAANRMIQENLTVSSFVQTKEQAETLAGGEAPVKPPCGVFNKSHQKTKAGDEVKVAFIPECVLAIPPSDPYASTGCLDTIVLDLKDSNIAAGMTSRRDATISLKFAVTVKEEGPLAEAAPTAPTAMDTRTLIQNKIRAPEGQILLQAQKEAAALAASQEDKAAAEKAAAAKPAEEEDFVVNAWEVKGKIDYTKLVKEFGSQLLTDDLLEKLKAETVGKGRVPHLHRFLRRNIFFSHRDLHTLLDQVQNKGQPMYLYTGRGPSSTSMHLGHLIPFLFTQWLQKALDCPLVIQMTDDEKFLFKGEYDETNGDNLNHFAGLTMENARDIIACEFDFNKTFLFSDLDYVGTMYPNIVRIWKAVTTNKVSNIFGFDGTANIGKVAFPAIQAAPSFPSSFPTVLQADHTSPRMCLIPCAIDQDPYFRMTRDVAHKMVRPGKDGKTHGLGGKPSLIHSKFFPPLQGADGKMSASDTNSAIFLTDTPEEIERKIGLAFSGGQDTKKKQEELGANLDVDVAYQWLTFFLDDDELLERIGKEYGSGKGEFWSTRTVKAKLIEILKDLVAAHQERRSKITDEEVRKWMKERSLVG